MVSFASAAVRALSPSLDEVEDVITAPILIDEPSAIEYADACSETKCTRCSQWQRACMSHAEDVVLSHYGLGKRGAVAFGRSLAVNVHVQMLDLGDNGLGSEGVVTLLKALQGSKAAPSLRVLSLRQNQAGEEGAEAVRDLLTGTSGHVHPLETLDFACNAIGNKGADSIADGLSSNTSLTSLCLEHNDIEHVEKLARAVGSNSTLTSLSLEWNQIPPSGGKHLADALSEASSLASLNIGWNGLGDPGAGAIASAIEARPACLRDIRMHHNRMTTESAVPFSRALVALDTLDVSGNALGQAGAAVLLLAQNELNARRGSPTPDVSDPEMTGGAKVTRPRCTLMMEDICVRPDTMLAGLMARAALGDELPHHELQAGGVLAAAAPALAAAAPTAKGGKAGKGGKSRGADGDKKKWLRNDEAEALPQPKPKAKPKGKAK